MIVEALTALESNPLLYRAVVALIVTLIINVCGYVENRVMNSVAWYNPRKLGETLMTYLPLIILFAEAMPIEFAILGSIIVDVARRIAERLS